MRVHRATQVAVATKTMPVAAALVSLMAVATSAKAASTTGSLEHAMTRQHPVGILVPLAVTLALRAETLLPASPHSANLHLPNPVTQVKCLCPVMPKNGLHATTKS